MINLVVPVECTNNAASNQQLHDASGDVLSAIWLKAHTLCRRIAGSPLALLLASRLALRPKAAEECAPTSQPEVVMADMGDAQLAGVVLLAYAAAVLPKLAVLEVTHVPPGVFGLLRRVLQSPELQSSLARCTQHSHLVRDRPKLASVQRMSSIWSHVHKKLACGLFTDAMHTDKNL
jgi:hypothetical protein